MKMRKDFLSITLILLFAIISTNLGADSDCGLCKLARVRKMKAADCYRRELKHIPKCVASDSEILELSVNRIRKIARADLSRFSYLQVLYLADNLLVHLDPDVFDDLRYLTTLDLSFNALSKLPPAVFQLPSLTSLYFSQNWNINIADSLEGVKPIKSPLTKMDISFTTDEDNIPEFPDFGPMPYLVSLNITGNRYSGINPKSIIGMCYLKTLITNNVTAEFNEYCDCWYINEWLTDKGVKFTQFNCPVYRDYCKNLTYKPEDLETYDQCIKIVAEIKKQQTIQRTLVVVGSFAAVLILVAVIGYLVYRRRKNRKRGQPVTELKNYRPPENLALLKNPLTSVPNDYEL